MGKRDSLLRINILFQHWLSVSHILTPKKGFGYRKVNVVSSFSDLLQVLQKIYDFQPILAHLGPVAQPEWARVGASVPPPKTFGSELK